MAAPDILQVPPLQNSMNDPTQVRSDICSPLSSSKQPEVLPMHPTLASEPPPYGTLLTIQQPMYPPPPFIVTHMHMPYQYVIVNGSVIPPQTAHIRDYIVWSAINVVIGGMLLGAIALLLSMQTKKRKREGNVIAARNMSKITLIFNIMTTIVFFVLTACLIVSLILNQSYR